MMLRQHYSTICSSRANNVNNNPYICPKNYPYPWTDHDIQLPASSLDPSDLPSRKPHPDPISHFATMHNTDRPTDGWRKSLMTIGCFRPIESNVWPNNSQTAAPFLFNWSQKSCFLQSLHISKFLSTINIKGISGRSFRGHIPFPSPNQQHRSTEWKNSRKYLLIQFGRPSNNSIFSWIKTWVSQHRGNLTILDFHDASDYRVAVASAGPAANHLHLTPKDNHASSSSLNFYGAFTHMRHWDGLGER